MIALPLTAQNAAVAAPTKPTARRHIKIPPPSCLESSTRNSFCEGPYSDAVQVGNTLYLAGTTGVDPQTGKVPTEFEQEVRFALDDMKQTLAAAGMTMDDVVSVQVFCTDLSLWDRFNAVYRTYFGTNLPARAFIGVAAILGGNRFEIMSIAVKD